MNISPCNPPARDRSSAVRAQGAQVNAFLPGENSREPPGRNAIMVRAVVRRSGPHRNGTTRMRAEESGQ